MKDWPRTMAIIAVVIAAICFVLYLLVFDTLVVPAQDAVFVASVQPALAVGDRILIRRGSVPQNGELARCVNPQSPTKIAIGRVFGQRGDKIDVVNERVGINGKGIGIRHGCAARTMVHPISEEQIQLNCGVEDNGAFTYEILMATDNPEGPSQTTIEDGKMYLLSDNRHIHEDSRDFGLVDAATCEHIVYRLWGESYSDDSRRFTVLW